MEVKTMLASFDGLIVSLDTFLATHKTIHTIVRIVGTIATILFLPGYIAAKVLPIRVLGVVGGILIALLGAAIFALGIWQGASILTIIMGGVLWLVGGYVWEHYESRKWRSRSFLFVTRKSPWKELNILGGHFLVLAGLASLVIWVAQNDIWSLVDGAIMIVAGGAIIDHLTHRPKPRASSKKTRA